MSLTACAFVDVCCVCLFSRLQLKLKELRWKEESAKRLYEVGAACQDKQGLLGWWSPPPSMHRVSTCHDRATALPTLTAATAGKRRGTSAERDLL